ncbi:CPBP family intramembrane glutamic endopeptidase [Olivibacter domesticus]|uniref:CAAX protease self-immunity n=1 Tax=Olivibacter domesticus TaxID=407022 RepID=A0A1H7H564_OLID1|nr:CPBP family intramembrane glutamic endopeptidase [Olivibacter domesticus]SEK44442.1 CAAX protease self-immunity [Olivibacter domesticus]
MHAVLDEIKKINTFIKQPVEFFPEQLTRKDKIRVFLSAILYKVLFVGFILVILYMIEKYLFVFQMPLLGTKLWVIFLYAVILAPLFEELIFRLPLRYNKNWIWRKIESLFRLQPQVFWLQNYKYILYTFVFLFGIVHLMNYTNKEFLFFLIAPLIVGSQLFGGLLLSYTRLKLGFWWGVAQHSIWNGLIITLSLILFHNKEVVNINREGFALSIHELGYLDKQEQVFELSQLKNGSVDLLEVKNGSIQQLMDSLYRDDHLVVLSDTWMNLTLKAPKGIDKKVLLNVLKEQYHIKSLTGK